MEYETSLQHKYTVLLADPTQVEQEDIQQLLKVFPYSHALWFMEAKRCIYANGDCQSLISRASLYAQSPEQLYAYVYAPPVNDPIFSQDDAVAKLDLLLNQQRKDAELPESKNVFAETEDVDNNHTAFTEIPLQPSTEEQQLSATSPLEETIKREDVAKYDDELMPYTFVWWLHKTRMDYADTYQPYAPKVNLLPKNPQSNRKDLFLDQQIRENIFHLQSPEDKLSIQDNKTITFKIPHKTDEIIERFINEEPQIKPPQANKITLENKARQSAEDQSIFVSETLAQIYVEQGLYHKAIDAYMKLSLKYPEKSVYFADRIKDLENKIN